MLSNQMITIFFLFTRQKTKILQMLSDIEKLIADPESVLLGDKEENAEMEDKKVLDQISHSALFDLTKFKILF